MKRVAQLAAAVLVASLIAGCGRTLNVTLIRPDAPRTGFGYVLPFTQFAMTVTWRLDYCPDPAKPDPIKGSEPKIALKVEAVAGSADDGTLAFLVDPQELQSLTSVTTFGAKWHDGRNMLSTINGSVEDRSAQIVGNVVKTAVKIIPLAMGVPSPPGGATLTTPAPPLIRCDDKAIAALAKAKTAKALLDVRNDAVDAATEVLKSVAAKVAAAGQAVDAATKRQLAKALDELTAAKVAQTEAADALVAALKPISYAHKFLWPQTGDEFSYGPDQLPQTTLATWIHKDDLSQVTPKAAYLQLERSGTFGRKPPRPDRTQAPDVSFSPTPAEAGDTAYRVPGPDEKGLRYRMPAGGSLVACWRSPCGSSDTEGVLAKLDTPVVQLGFVNVLAFRSRIFGTNAFSADFAVDGSLKAVSYEQKTAPAEVATGAVADATSQLSGVFDPTTRLQSQTAYLKALKERKDALEALRDKAPDPVAAEQASLDSDTALINAQIANLKAQIALEELKAKRP